MVGLRQLVGQQKVTVPNHTGQALGELVFRLYPNLPQFGGRMMVTSVQVDGETVAYYRASSGSFGLTAGVSSFSQVMAFMTDEALNGFQGKKRECS